MQTAEEVTARLQEINQACATAKTVFSDPDFQFAPNGTSGRATGWIRPQV